MSMIWEVYRSLFKKRATIAYPLTSEGVPAPEGLRGRMALKREVCIGCTLCEKDCPGSAIEIVADEKGKRPIFYLDRCLFCGQCMQTCPVHAIEFTKYFENAAYSRKDLVVK